MIPVTHFSGRDVAIFGLGRTGLAAARALIAGGARVHAWDDNEKTREAAAEAGIPLNDINKMDWQQFAALVLSPGVPLHHPEPHRVVKLANSVDVPILGDMELFAMAVNELPDRSRPQVVGITGTNGKSTTTALIGHILKKAGKDVRVGGNIGIGVLDMEPLTANSVYVLELSSYQLDLVETLRCDVAVLLNISSDHLSRHGGMPGYVKAKMRIFNNQLLGDTAIFGMDDSYSQIGAMKIARSGGPRTVTVSAQFALGRGVSVVEGRLFDSTSGRAIRVGDLRDAPNLTGQHNHQNAAAAYAVCRALNVEASVIMDAIISFPGLAHRMELAGVANGVKFVNDSKATNAQAAAQALRSYEDIYWIVGGQAKEDGLEGLEQFYPRIRKAYLIGEAENRFAEALDGKIPYMKCGTLRRALAEAHHNAVLSGNPEPVVLLAPACASFDQFKDFEARGDAFKELVRNLVENDTVQQASA